MSPSLPERLAATIASLPGIRLAVLFGSCARGVTRPGSDVDLGLLLEEGAPPRHTLEAAIGRAAGRAVDVVYLLECPPQLAFEIARDGKVLQERRPYAWADFRARAMRAWWDWRPFARIMTAAHLRRLREG